MAYTTQSCLSNAWRRRLHACGSAAKIARQGSAPAGRIQGVQALRPEHPRQGVDREQEPRIPLRLHPVSRRIQAATGDQHVDVHMSSQILSPGMQYRGKRRFRPQPTGIPGELQQGFRHHGQQRVVHPAVVNRREGIERMGQGEDQVGIGNRQQFGEAPLGPSLLRAGLAGGAMTVAAGVVDVFTVPAVVTRKAMAAEGGGAAVAHGAPDLCLRGAHAVGVERLGPEGLEDLGQGSGHRRSSTAGTGSVQRRQSGEQVEGVGVGRGPPLG